MQDSEILGKEKEKGLGITFRKQMRMKVRRVMRFLLPQDPSSTMVEAESEGGEFNEDLE